MDKLLQAIKEASAKNAELLESYGETEDTQYGAQRYSEGWQDAINQIQTALEKGDFDFNQFVNDPEDFKD